MIYYEENHQWQDQTKNKMLFPNHTLHYFYQIKDKTQAKRINDTKNTSNMYVPIKLIMSWNPPWARYPMSAALFLPAVCPHCCKSMLGQLLSLTEDFAAVQQLSVIPGTRNLSIEKLFILFLLLMLVPMLGLKQNVCHVKIIKNKSTISGLLSLSATLTVIFMTWSAL